MTQKLSAMKWAGPVVNVDITGYVFGGCKRGDGDVVFPCVFRFASAADQMILPCFSTVERMRKAYAEAGQQFDEVEMIAKPRTFLESVPREVTVVVDLRLDTTTGEWKFLRVVFD